MSYIQSDMFPFRSVVNAVCSLCTVQVPSLGDIASPDNLIAALQVVSYT